MDIGYRSTATLEQNVFFGVHSVAACVSRGAPLTARLGYAATKRRRVRDGRFGFLLSSALSVLRLTLPPPA